MEVIEICISGSKATVTKTQPVVAGTVGLPVQFTFDEAWDQLEKTAVFRVNGKIMDKLYVENRTTVPWELLKKPGCRLWCGVYGCSEDGSVQIPTLWVDLGTVEPGADPSGDESADPDLPVWQQLTEDVEQALEEILKMQQNIIDGVTPITTGGDSL